MDKLEKLRPRGLEGGLLRLSKVRVREEGSLSRSVLSYTHGIAEV